MMRTYILALFIILFSPLLQAQTFTEAERSKILQGDTTKMMRVTQITEPEENKILTTASSDIAWDDPLLPILKARMLYSMLDPENEGIGIAAPQVGINRNVFWVQRMDKVNKPYEFYINPKIIWYSDLKQLGPEGCLSIPDIRGDVMRSYAIQISYYTIDGAHHTEVIEGFTAVIFQHEYDHLNGILFTQRTEEQKGNEYQPMTKSLFR